MEFSVRKDGVPVVTMVIILSVHNVINMYGGLWIFCRTAIMKVEELDTLWICVCVFWYQECVACPNYETTRVIQPGFKPYTEATPVLDSGCPRELFNPDNKVCMPMTRGDIVHRIIYNRYKYNRQWAKYRQAGQQLIILWYF